MLDDRPLSDYRFLRLQATIGKTVLFVTHSIEEAVQLSSQVAVITPRPGRIDRLIPIDLPFPRNLAVKNSPTFIGYVREIQEIFRGFGVI